MVFVVSKSEILFIFGRCVLEKPYAFAIQSLDFSLDKIVWQYWGFGPLEVRRILLEELGVQENDLVEGASPTGGMTFATRVAGYHALYNSKSCWIVGSLLNGNYCSMVPSGYSIACMPCPHSDTNDILVCIPTANQELVRAFGGYFREHLVQLGYNPSVSVFNQARSLLTIKGLPMTASEVTKIKKSLVTLFNEGSLCWTWPT